MKHIITFAIILFVGLAFTFNCAAETFEELLSKAKQYADTPQGIKYDNQVGYHLIAPLNAAMKECLDKTQNPDPSKFNIIFELSKDGTITKLLIKPETNLALCVKPALAKNKLPSPPFAPYLAFIEWGFK